MKLLKELVEQVQYIEEENKDGKKTSYLSGIFLQGAIPNRNKRIYPDEILTNETNRYIKENVQRNNGWGELGHPSGPNINLPLVCLRTTELIKEGTNFRGKAIVTDTPMGDIVKGLQASGGRLGVSSRALGSLKPWRDNKDINEVQDDLRILAIDCVADPSAPDAWVDGILEDVDYFYTAKNGQIAEQAKKTIKTLSTKQLTEQKLAMFQRFLNDLSK